MDPVDEVVKEEVEDVTYADFLEIGVATTTTMGKRKKRREGWVAITKSKRKKKRGIAVATYSQEKEDI